MSSHDCIIFGTLTLREGVTEEQVIDAFKHLDSDLRNEIEKEQNEGGITIEDGEVSFNLDIRISGGGYRQDSIESFSEIMNGLIEGYGYFMLFDLDSGNTDTMRVPYFVGASESDRKKAQVEYGLDEAHDWIAPIVGKEAMELIRKQIMAFVRESMGEC